MYSYVALQSSNPVDFYSNPLSQQPNIPNSWASKLGFPYKSPINPYKSAQPLGYVGASHM